MSQRFNEMLYGVGENIRENLCCLSDTVKQNTEEIRLRKGLPLAITVAGETVFVKRGGQTSFYPENGLITVSESDVTQSFRLLCNNSAFAHGEELKNGYIKLKNGSRAGVFGTVNREGQIQDVTGINIRIARQIKGAASHIAMSFRGEGWLLTGPPGCGKTTLLRDFIRQISSGVTGKIYRVAVIDSRGEISGFGSNDLGLATDIINTEEKASGIEIAIRTMFPEVLAFDEIGSMHELERVKDGFNAGVSIITTAHITNAEELLKRDITSSLLKSGVISRVAVLPKLYGGEIKIFTLKELFNDFV